jgi:hypothetical protein
VRADIVAALGEFDAAHGNGELPATLVAGAPGEIGVAVLCHRFYDGMHFRATRARPLHLLPDVAGPRRTPHGW